MNSIGFFVVLSVANVLGLYDGSETVKFSKHRRDTSGALEIFTNHENPIHADIKNDNTGLTEKPCPKMNLVVIPSDIEPGTVFQVTPPKNYYMGKSLRKSYPISTKWDLIRAISRAVTIISLLFSAVVEFYPVFRHLYDTVRRFIE